VVKVARNFDYYQTPKTKAISQWQNQVYMSRSRGIGLV